MEKKVVERRNGRYQINEGIFDIIKILITGSAGDIKKIKDKNLSKAGRELKKSVVDMSSALDKEAKKQGKTKEEVTQDILDQLGLKSTLRT